MIMSSSPLNSEPTISESPTSIADSENDKIVSDKTMTGTFLKDRFELLETVGAGGMGEVYKALDLRDVEAGNSRFIAIKVLHVQFRDDSKLLKALHSEARKTQNLAHTNIIRAYDFDRDSDHVFMTMEYMEGVSLDKIIRGNPSGLAHDKALHFINQLVQALHYAHSQGLIHSDLKPGNVLVAKNDHLKVLDFGISRLLDYNRTNEFDAGVISAYTPAYSTLEMIHNGSPDPRDDVYALACISYELFTGQHPFQRLSAEQAMQQGLEPQAADVFSSLQWQTLKQALNFDRSHRLATVNEFWQGMQVEEKAPKSRWTALFSVLILAFVFLAFWFVSQQQHIIPAEQAMISSGLTTDKTMPGKGGTLESEGSSITNDNGAAPQPVKTSPTKLSQLLLELNQTQFKLGETLEITFQVNSPTYVRIILVNSTGELVHLFPNPFQQQFFCQPDISYQIPPTNAEFTLDIQPPVGSDKIIAISSPVPFSENFLQLDEQGELLLDGLPESFVVTEKIFEIVESI